MKSRATHRMVVSLPVASGLCVSAAGLSAGEQPQRVIAS